MRKKSASGVLASLRGSPYCQSPFLRFAPSLAAALLDDLFVHPAGNSNFNMLRDLIVLAGARVDFPAVF
jgi:hypothetical protein